MFFRIYALFLAGIQFYAQFIKVEIWANGFIATFFFFLCLYVQTAVKAMGDLDMKKVIPVFFATDDNYAPFVAVTLESILDNASKEFQYKFYILTTSISDEYKTAIEKYNSENVSVEFVFLSETIESVKEKFAIRDYYSMATYYRFFIADMFPQYNKALYLDCDIAVLGDISELFNTNVRDFYLGAIPDESLFKYLPFSDYVENALGIQPAEYFNAGIMVMNLAAFRKYDILSQFIELMKKYKFRVAQDQDYLNVICKNKVKFIETGWNKGAVLTPGFDESTLKLVHYNLNRKPWQKTGVKYEEYFWKYAEKTEFAGMIHEKLSGYSEADRAKDDECLEGLINLCTQEAASEINYYNTYVKRYDIWKNLLNDLKSFLKSMSTSVTNGGHEMLKMTRKLFR